VRVAVRRTEERDFPAIIRICRRVYPTHPPYSEEQLASHETVFPEGQLTAVETAEGAADGAGRERVVGMAASLIVRWDDYDIDLRWRDFTAGGTFTNHDASGRTLYGAEVMVDPEVQGGGAGSALYVARDELLRDLGLLRIRAGARLRGYHAWAGRLTPEEYVQRVVRGELRDPTLTFQLNRGFRVVAVVSGYLSHDPDSLGYAAVIEKLNPELATPEDYERGDPRFRAPEA
jgi:GNAT superfamily N-acetyltransferase